VTASAETAWGEINGQLNTEWLADVLTATVPLLWDNVIGDPPSTKDADGNPQPWARAVVRHATGENAAIGGRLFMHAGQVFVQIFTPAGVKPKLPYQLAEVAKRAFEGRATASGVWFRDVRVNEVGQSGDWFQVNVIADFTYDHLR
jgi:hypothetical protein